MIKKYDKKKKIKENVKNKKKKAITMINNNVLSFHWNQ